MADRWMDDRDRDWRDRERRERDWRDRESRRTEAYGPRAEDRSWTRMNEEEAAPYEEMGRHRGVYGEDEDYGGRSGLAAGGGAYGGQGYGRGRSQPYSSGASLGRYGAQTPRFTPQDYTGSGDADERGRADYGYPVRQAYGRAQADVGVRRSAWEPGEPRSYEAERERRESRAWESYPARGETGDFERGRDRWDEGREGEGGGDFLHRAGERISSWFRGDNLMHGSREEERDQPRRYREDFGREARPIDRGHRGRGPKGYQRSDERISDEVHDHLTEDPWLDASDIYVEVKDGEVTLSGHVDNRESKHRAERLIEDLSGVRHVQNNLRMESSPLTGAGRGFGSSALEAEMRRNAAATDPGDKGASGLSGRTSTGAAAERSSETGAKRN